MKFILKIEFESDRIRAVFTDWLLNEGIDSYYDYCTIPIDCANDPSNKVAHSFNLNKDTYIITSESIPLEELTSVLISKIGSSDV
jgi:hypothetical protein